MEWNLDRGTVKEILQELSTDRKLQTTFTNLVGATRFKTVKDGKLHHAICPRCEDIDSWEHCMKCYNIEPIKKLGQKNWLKNIDEVMNKLTTDTPAKYKPAERLHEGRRNI